MKSPPRPDAKSDAKTDADADAFTTLYEALATRVYAYARRHCDAADAQDVVADTFLVAWRRWSQLPDDPLPWLLVVARNTIANRHRTSLRHHRLADAASRLTQLGASADSTHEHVAEREAMIAALAELSELEREAVLLVAWDGLSNADAATVAGCSQRAFEVRLSRARARITRSVTTGADARRAPLTARKAT